MLLIQSDEVLHTRNVLLEIEQRLENVLSYQQQTRLRSLGILLGKILGYGSRLQRKLVVGLQAQHARIKSYGTCNTVGNNSRTCPVRDDATISITQQISAPIFD